MMAGSYRNTDSSNSKHELHDLHINMDSHHRTWMQQVHALACWHLIQQLLQGGHMAAVLTCHGPTSQ